MREQAWKKCSAKQQQHQKKVIPWHKQAIPFKKVAMLTKRNAEIAASHFVIVFRVAVSRKLGKYEILCWEKL